jgi:hypothetical protein
MESGEGGGKKESQEYTKMEKHGWAPVAHAFNPSSSGGRGQEDHGLRPAWANSSQDAILTNPSQKKKGLMEWLKV